MLVERVVREHKARKKQASFMANRFFFFSPGDAFVPNLNCIHFQTIAYFNRILDKFYLNLLKITGTQRMCNMYK